jgi:ABC-type amino acid transport substrate-binding protein
MKSISYPQMVLSICLVAVISSWATIQMAPTQNAGVISMEQFKAQPDQLDKIMAAKTLRCGYIEYPPYFSKDVNTGEMKGLMVDVMQQVATKMQVKLEWSYETTWATMFEDLKANRFDAVCSNVWQNTVRSIQSDFSLPIVYSPIQAWVRTGDTRFDGKLSAINAQYVTIPTLDGEMIEKIAKEQFPKAKTIALPQNAPYADVITNVVMKKGDIVFLEPKVALDYLKTNPESLQRVKNVPNIGEFPVVVILPKNNPRFKAVIDTAIMEIKNTASLPLLLEKYDMTNNVIVR